MAKVSASKTVGVSRDALRRAREKAAVPPPEQKQAKSTTGHISIPKPAARMEGGPKDGWVYFIDDLEHEQRIAERMGTVFPYSPTRRKCVLPWTGGVEGIWWRWTGAA